MILKRFNKIRPWNRGCWGAIHIVLIVVGKQGRGRSRIFQPIISSILESGIQNISRRLTWNEKDAYIYFTFSWNRIKLGIMSAKLPFKMNDRKLHMPITNIQQNSLHYRGGFMESLYRPLITICSMQLKIHSACFIYYIEFIF